MGKAVLDLHFLVQVHPIYHLSGYLEDKLTEEEGSVYKRGRNAKSYTSAKNASISDYRRATGFEALMGYLYLSGQYERMCELIKDALDWLENDNKQA